MTQKQSYSNKKSNIENQKDIKELFREGILGKTKRPVPPNKTVVIFTLPIRQSWSFLYLMVYILEPKGKKVEEKSMGVKHEYRRNYWITATVIFGC